MLKTAISAALFAMGCANAWGEGPVANETAIGAPTAIAVHPSGKVYFSSQNIVFAVGPDGILERIAGTGEPGYAGDGGPATAALLNFPLTYPELEHDFIDFWEFAAGLAFDADANLYIADAYNGRVRKVDALDGTISTVSADVGWAQGVAFDSIGRLHVTSQNGQLLRIAGEKGQVEQIATLEVPEGIAIDRDDNIFVAEAWCKVKMVKPDLMISIAVGYEGCQAGAGLSWPYGVAVDGEGNLYVADTFDHCILRKSAGKVEAIAGRCDYRRQGFSGDGGPAASARFTGPKGIAVDIAGNIYVADTGNNRVRRIDPEGIVTTIAGNGLPLP